MSQYQWIRSGIAAVLLALPITQIACARTSDATPVPSATDTASPTKVKLKSETWLEGVELPWGLVFADENTAFITELDGAVYKITDGKRAENPVAGTPTVWRGGQGGMLDIAVDPDYSENGWVYLAFSHGKSSDPDSDLAMTKIVRGKIQENVWSEEQLIFEAYPAHYLKGGRHFGSRITFDDSGHIFFSIGDRGKRQMAQDISVPNGKIHRLMRDGTLPKDNPFARRKNAYGSIYSYGNRNPQGLVFGDGNLWSTEHGPKGGDELNLITAGANYGWPKISYGREYSGRELTPHTHMKGMEQPVSQWTPSIAASGLDIYHGVLFKDWQGHLLAGGLAYQDLRLIKTDGPLHITEEILLKDKGRVRDVTIGLDGAIYVVLNGPDKVLRLTPQTH